MKTLFSVLILTILCVTITFADCEGKKLAIDGPFDSGKIDSLVTHLTSAGARYSYILSTICGSTSPTPADAIGTLEGKTFRFERVRQAPPKVNRYNMVEFPNGFYIIYEDTGKNRQPAGYNYSGFEVRQTETLLSK
jgi:hypothetical protein